jgi:hypothetical protein
MLFAQANTGQTDVAVSGTAVVAENCRHFSGIAVIGEDFMKL